jgi:uncharacterized protein (TIGR00730 family)
MPTLCVFCGSSFGINPVYVEETIRFGRIMAEKGIGLVYGGGNTGLMGTLADAVLQHGGRVTGVIPSKLVERERAHNNLTTLHIVNSMHERKAMMAELSDGFVALPGGLGTFDEFCEILTWNQLGFISKPTGILNTSGYYDHLISQIEFSAEEGFISQGFKQRIIIEDDSERLLEMLSDFTSF